MHNHIFAHLYTHGFNIGSWLAHAFVWSAVSVFMRQNPWLAPVVIVVAVAFIVIVWVRRRRSRAASNVRAAGQSGRR